MCIELKGYFRPDIFIWDKYDVHPATYLKKK